MVMWIINKIHIMQSVTGYAVPTPLRQQKSIVIANKRRVYELVFNIFSTTMRSFGFRCGEEKINYLSRMVARDCVEKNINTDHNLIQYIKDRIKTFQNCIITAR